MSTPLTLKSSNQLFSLQYKLIHTRFPDLKQIMLLHCKKSQKSTSKKTYTRDEQLGAMLINCIDYIVDRTL